MAEEAILRDAAGLAPRLGISPQLLRRQAKAGKIPHVYIGDRLLFIEAQVVEHLREQAATRLKPETRVPDVPRRRRRIVQPVTARPGGGVA